jgi:hypothetical protein
MNPVPLNLPPGSEKVNFLQWDIAPAELTQDLLTVQLPNGFCIDVGWFPEHDPSGNYWINVFFENPDKQQLDKPIVTKDLHVVVHLVERLASRFSSGVGYLANATTAPAVSRPTELANWFALN